MGQLWYTLAFITSMGTRPAWGGVIDVKDQFFADQVSPAAAAALGLLLLLLTFSASTRDEFAWMRGGMHGEDELAKPLDMT